jgi:hypothetical protein
MRHFIRETTKIVGMICEQPSILHDDKGIDISIIMFSLALEK